VGIICAEKKKVFREGSLEKIGSFEEQIMCKDKYASIFSLQIEAIVFVTLEIFSTACVALKIVVYHSDTPHFLLGNIQARDAFIFKSIALERNI